MTRTTLIHLVTLANTVIFSDAAIAQTQFLLHSQGGELQYSPSSVAISQIKCQQSEPGSVDLSCSPIAHPLYSATCSLTFGTHGTVVGVATGSATPACNRIVGGMGGWSFEDHMSIIIEAAAPNDPDPTPPFTIHAHVAASGSTSPILPPEPGSGPGQPDFRILVNIGVEMFDWIRQTNGPDVREQMPLIIQRTSFSGTLQFTGYARGLAFLDGNCLHSQGTSWGGSASVQATLLGFSGIDALGHVVRVRALSGTPGTWYRDVINDLPICPGDVPIGGGPGNGTVNIDDLVAVITNWGATGLSVVADINFDQIVNIDDLVQVITHWGACP